jgi:tetratricopeptide (TPR) repeat protein
MGGKRTRMWQQVHLCLATLILFSLMGCTTLREIQNREEAQKHLLLGQRFLVRGDFEGSLRETHRAWSLSPSQPPADEALFTMALIYVHFGNSKRDDKKSLDFLTVLMRDHPESPWAEQAKIWANVLQENDRLNRTIQTATAEIESLRQTLEAFERSQPPEPKETKAPKAPQATKAESRDVAREHLLQGQRLLSQGNFEGSFQEIQKALARSPQKPPEDEALYTLGLLYAHAENPSRDYKKSLEVFRKLMRDHPKSPWAEQARIWAEVLEQNENLNQVIERSKQVDLEIEEKKREKVK